MKKIVAGLLCMCMLCGALGGCGAKEPPMTLPHNENIRLDMTRDEIVAVDGVESLMYTFTGFYKAPNQKTNLFLNLDCTIMYSFIGQHLTGYWISAPHRPLPYDKEYKEWVKTFSRLYGKGQSETTNPLINSYKTYEATTWEFAARNELVYTLNVSKTSDNSEPTEYFLSATIQLKCDESQRTEMEKQSRGTTGYYDFNWGIAPEQVKRRECSNFVFMPELSSENSLTYEVEDLKSPFARHKKTISSNPKSMVTFWFEKDKLVDIKVDHKGKSPILESVFNEEVAIAEKLFGRTALIDPRTMMKNSSTAYFETEHSVITLTTLYEHPSFSVTYSTRQ